jgi:NADH-ubiquinone oxidoreductase chain 4
MGLALGGIITINFWGLYGSYVIIIGHGLCSSGLFCLANISYERLGSRNLYMNKGIINFFPSLRLWWFLLVSSNIAAPPSLNLLGEICLINRIVSWRWVSIIIISLISFFSAAYSLYLYSFTQHGKIYSGSFSFSIITVREYQLLILHWLPLNILIIKSDNFILWIYLSNLIKILVCGTKNVSFYLR